MAQHAILRVSCWDIECPDYCHIPTVSMLIASIVSNSFVGTHSHIDSAVFRGFLRQQPAEWVAMPSPQGDLLNPGGSNSHLLSYKRILHYRTTGRLHI